MPAAALASKSSNSSLPLAIATCTITSASEFHRSPSPPIHCLPPSWSRRRWARCCQCGLALGLPTAPVPARSQSTAWPRCASPLRNTRSHAQCITQEACNPSHALTRSCKLAQTFLRARLGARVVQRGSKLQVALHALPRRLSVTTSTATAGQCYVANDAE
jgi:hypothetical protein